MPPKGLYILVEGPSDDDFAKLVLSPLFQSQYTWVQTDRYAQKNQTDLNKFIQTIPKLGADYIFISDLDEHPCISTKKEKLKRKYQALDHAKIIIVKMEIEGWYLAGLPLTQIQTWKMTDYITTDTLTKEQFNAFKPKQFISNLVFMRAILKVYDPNIAQQKNQSFNYFYTKYLPD